MVDLYHPTLNLKQPHKIVWYKLVFVAHFTSKFEKNGALELDLVTQNNFMNHAYHFTLESIKDI